MRRVRLLLLIAALPVFDRAMSDAAVTLALKPQRVTTFRGNSRPDGCLRRVIARDDKVTLTK